MQKHGKDGKTSKNDEKRKKVGKERKTSENVEKISTAPSEKN